MPVKETEELRKPFVSRAKHKKYSVYVIQDGRRKLIHFGDKRHKQYKDRLGHYRHLDHHDKKRRKAYYTRFGPATDENTAKWFAHNYLW